PLSLHDALPIYVADPVRLEDRLPTSDGQGVERADRTLGVALEVVEVGRLEPLGHSLDGAEMDFEGFLDAVEHPADTGRDVGVARDRVHVAPAEQVDVDLGTDPLQRAGQLRSVLLRRNAFSIDLKL